MHSPVLTQIIILIIGSLYGVGYLLVLFHHACAKHSVKIKYIRIILEPSSCNSDIWSQEPLKVIRTKAHNTHRSHSVGESSNSCSFSSTVSITEAAFVLRLQPDLSIHVAEVEATAAFALLIPTIGLIVWGRGNVNWAWPPAKYYLITLDTI